MHYSFIDSSFPVALPIVSIVTDKLLFRAILDSVSLKGKFMDPRITALAALKCLAGSAQIKEGLVVVNQWIFDCKFFLKIFLFAYLILILAGVLSYKIKYLQ